MVGVLSPDSIDWSDNLAGVSFADSLIPEPIDIVYTWVNGSDPKQMDGSDYAHAFLWSFPRFAAGRHQLNHIFVHSIAALLRTKLELLQGKNMTGTTKNILTTRCALYEIPFADHCYSPFLVMLFGYRTSTM
jgi:hypothetical protein